MKKLIFAVALILVAQFSFAQETTETFELKGKVRFVEESSYEFVEKFGEVELGDFLGRDCKVFNEKGFLIKKVLFCKIDFFFKKLTSRLFQENFYTQKSFILQKNVFLSKKVLPP